MSKKLRIALIGKTGNGKSSTGNMILQTKLFECAASTNAVTNETQTESGLFSGREFNLTDTPGLFDPYNLDFEISTKFRKTFDQLIPGPHVFLVVLKSTRLTEEDKLIIPFLNNFFGNQVLNYCIIVFTRIDDLNADGSDLNTFINTNLNQDLKDLLKKCNNRYVGFNNRISYNSESNQRQVKALFEKIDEVTNLKMEKYFMSEVFDYNVQNIQNQREKINKTLNLTYTKIKDKIDQTESNTNNNNNQILNYIRNKRFPKDCNLL